MKTKRFLSLFLVLVMLVVPTLTITSGAASSSTRPSIVGVHVRVESGFCAYFYIEAPSSQTTEVGIFVGEERIQAQKQDDGRYVAVIRGLSPTKMADLIAVYPYAVIGTSSNVRGTEYLFGLQDYAMNLLSQEELPEATRDLLIAMLNYGAACQIKQGYRTHMPANMGLSEEEKIVPVRPYENVLQVPVFGEEDISYSSAASAYYLDRLVFSFGFIIDGLEDAADVYMEIADNPEFVKSSRYELAKSKTVYSADTDGIYLNSLTKPYYIRVSTPIGVTLPISYSVESYAHLVLETEAGDAIDEDTKAYLAALIAFGDALQAYEAAATATE
ncbi:MAG: hypothetical protein IJ009_04255 [Clostridia bacterium]|nr:hypothetical protein [Clostridia bacterium]